MRNIERTEQIGWEAESAERRSKNRESSAAILTEHGVKFESKSTGVHLIVTHEGKVVDFWPGTGKYIVRGTGKSGRGVFNLIKLVGAKK